MFSGFPDSFSGYPLKILAQTSVLAALTPRHWGHFGRFTQYFRGNLGILAETGSVCTATRATPFQCVIQDFSTETESLIR